MLRTPGTPRPLSPALLRFCLKVRQNLQGEDRPLTCRKVPAAEHFAEERARRATLPLRRPPLVLQIVRLAEQLADFLSRKPKKCRRRRLRWLILAAIYRRSAYDKSRLWRCFLSSGMKIDLDLQGGGAPTRAASSPQRPRSTNHGPMMSVQRCQCDGDRRWLSSVGGGGHGNSSSIGYANRRHRGMAGATTALFFRSSLAFS